MVFTLCSSAAIVQKAGLNVNSTAAASAAMLQAFSKQAEGYVNAKTRYDWATNYSKVNTEFKGVLTDVVSSKAAMALISYDMSGYTQTREAETMLDFNRDVVNLGVAFLEENKHKGTIGV